MEPLEKEVLDNEPQGEKDRLMHRVTTGTKYGALIGFLAAVTAAVATYYTCPGMEEIRETYTALEQLSYVATTSLFFLKPAGISGAIVGAFGGGISGYFYHKRQQ